MRACMALRCKLVYIEGKIRTHFLVRACGQPTGNVLMVWFQEGWDWMLSKYGVMYSMHAHAHASSGQYKMDAQSRIPWQPHIRAQKYLYVIHGIQLRVNCVKPRPQRQHQKHTHKTAVQVVCAGAEGGVTGNRGVRSGQHGEQKRRQPVCRYKVRCPEGSTVRTAN